MAQKTKKQIALDHIRTAALALELIKVRVQEDISKDYNEERIDNIIAKIIEIRRPLDKLVVEM